MKRLLIFGLFLSCKTSEKCDAYGSVKIPQLDFIQVVGFTDTIPTFSDTTLTLPKGKYQIKGWKDGNEILFYVKL